MFTKETITNNLNQIRKNAPLVHNITNYVVMNNTANALLSIGASPVMAHAIEEVEDMVGIASALVINMGTLSNSWVESMKKAGQKAKALNTPIVFDPVGVGATTYRTQVANEIIELCQPSIIRGNGSEIMALVQSNTQTKGVDSLIESDSALESAKLLAQSNKCIVVISGEVDYITDGQEVISIKNGHPLMPKITGMGCTATAIMGAFAAVEKNPLYAAAACMAVMGIAGQMAAALSKGPGSFQINFIDCLYAISENEINQYYEN
ncbi:MAG: hydroxyethylthiazole kinase [Marinifilaceae bacterium]|nr:hydroxyethylthiazole kinase [Marinifilaceae bacterium]